MLGFALLGPLVLGEPRPHRILDSGSMQALGRWSYSIFIWHLVVLSAVFPLAGVLPFSGSMPAVWALTVLLTIGVSAASYSWLEDPARRWLRRWEARSGSTAAVHPQPNQPPRHGDGVPREDHQGQHSR